MLADNKLALNATWDEELLAEELKSLMATDIEFDIGLTGFTIAEVDSLVEGLIPQEAGDPDDDVLPTKAVTRCRAGDLWQLGPHRLICGNALECATVEALMDGKRAQLVFTDPPYNQRINGHVKPAGRTKHREFAMASGEMTSAEFTSFLHTSFRRHAEVMECSQERAKPLEILFKRRTRECRHSVAMHGCNDLIRRFSRAKIPYQAETSKPEETSRDHWLLLARTFGP
jgi:hypothetical protein